MCGFPLMPWRLVNSSLENPREKEAVQQNHKASQALFYFSSTTLKPHLLNYVCITFYVKNSYLLF